MHGQMWPDLEARPNSRCYDHGRTWLVSTVTTGYGQFSDTGTKEQEEFKLEQQRSFHSALA